MKIAILSPIAWRTPPEKYGPWEQVASNITEGLVEKGYDVTLFATADSITKAKLEWACQLPYEIDKDNDPKVLECLHISHLMEQSEKFDLIHNHFDFLPLTYSTLIKTPMVTTVHGFSSHKILPVYKKYNASNYYVSISNSDRNTELDYISTIYHGIDPKAFNFVRKKEDYLLFFGRIHPHKGTHAAIEIARKAGFPLKIAGLIQDEPYFNREVLPYIDDENIFYLGNVGSELRQKLMEGAKALLHPIYFEEPFGLSVIEAMMCGTPVIAFNRGSMPELIKEGINGYLPTNIQESILALQAIDKIDPQTCRDYALKNFSLDTMVNAYIETYRKVLEGEKIK